MIVCSVFSNSWWSLVRMVIDEGAAWCTAEAVDLRNLVISLV